jgi:flagellar hook-associated protein FlgK
MFGALEIAGSGLNAANAILSTAANNTANLNTPNYRPESVNLEPVPGGGVEVAGISADQPGPFETEAITDAIEFKRAQNLYDSNAAVIQSQEQMFGSLINILDTDYTQPPERTVP